MAFGKFWLALGCHSFALLNDFAFQLFLSGNFVCVSFQFNLSAEVPLD
jgi:hypothetical protein